jgi:hypothetical protein
MPSLISFTAISGALLLLLGAAIWFWNREPATTRPQAAPPRDAAVKAHNQASTAFISHDPMPLSAGHSRAPGPPHREVQTQRVPDVSSDCASTPATEFLSRDEILGLGASPTGADRRDPDDSAPTTAFCRDDLLRPQMTVALSREGIVAGTSDEQ